MATHVLTIPQWRPPLANDWKGRHWAIAHKMRKEATDFIIAYARQQRIPAATGRRRLSLLVRLQPRRKRFDKDAADKLFLDACKRAGLLIDDGERGLEGRVEVTFERGTVADWGCALTLVDVEED